MYIRGNWGWGLEGCSHALFQMATDRAGYRLNGIQTIEPMKQRQNWKFQIAQHAKKEHKKKFNILNVRTCKRVITYQEFYYQLGKQTYQSCLVSQQVRFKYAGTRQRISKRQVIAFDHQARNINMPCIYVPYMIQEITHRH